MSTESTQVLVVGGGLVGLSQAVFLASRGVPTRVVERHAGSSPHPRAIGFTARTMELFRSVGLGDIPQAPPGFRLRRVEVESLAGAWRDEEHWSPDAPEQPAVEHSPYLGAAMSQDRLEPILKARGLELGADIRFSTGLLRFEQDGSGVTAWVQEGGARELGAREYAIRADYLIAADGHRSPVREALKIGRSGRGYMQTIRSVLFRAPLEEYLKSGVSQFSIEQPGFSAFLTTYHDGRWVLMFHDDVERDPATLTALVQKAVGRTDIPIELITTGRWELSALIADRFQEGRVFLAGDAAHTLPPNRGGYGANTGIEDAHNLAWKMAAALSGSSRPTLLETYDAERRPIAWLRHDQIFARDDYRAHAPAGMASKPILDDVAMELGQLYRSKAIIGAGADLPAARRPDEWAGQPGTRAPHLWLSSEGAKASTLDLFQRGWVLLTAHQGWASAVAEASSRLRIDLATSLIRDPRVRAAYGLEEGGASLIRPDGYVAWRSVGFPQDPPAELLAALASAASASA